MKNSFLLLSFLLSSCTDFLDRPIYSKFETPEQNKFIVETQDGSCDWRVCINNKDHDRWIKQYLEINKMCPKGYKITRTEKGPLQSTFNDMRYVKYHGECL